MTNQSPFPLAGRRASLPQRVGRRPDWPRLMPEADAAAYLGVGETMLREHGPTPKKWRGRTLWDRKDLDRFADALDGQPLDDHEAGSHARDVEARWRDQRKKQGKG